ncbi:MAG: DNA alkylation repair protein [Campylobacter sp.]|nr:DNA alkylation repair protein [Campylobacter sp.]
MQKLRNELLKLSDTKHAKFMTNLLPNFDNQKILGIKTTSLKNIAKELIKSGKSDEFMAKLPHFYLEENLIHAFIINQIKDMNLAVNRLDKFLEFVDNWAVCDALIPQIFKTHQELLEEQIYKYLKSNQPYKVRFGIYMLMKNYQKEHFKLSQARLISQINSDEYYIQMMAAWYFCELCAINFELGCKFLEILIPPIKAKAIQKIIQSYKFSEIQKQIIKSKRDNLAKK